VRPSWLGGGPLDLPAPIPGSGRQHPGCPADQTAHHQKHERTNYIMKVKQYSRELPVKSIRVSPYHFRKETADERLDDLARSIREVGLIHAVSVVEDPSGAYELINGHRRLRAHKRANLAEIRANIYEYEPEELNDEQVRQQAVVQFLLAANSAEPLIPIERARYYEDAMNNFGWDVADLARVHHVSEAAVVDDLMFLNLDPRVLDLVQAHRDSFSQEHLRVLAEHATPSNKKAWTITPEEQVKAAEELAHQRDKKLVDSSRAFRAHVQSMVKKRREEAAASKRRVGQGSEDPVKSLFKLIESARKTVDQLVKADLSPIKEIDARDKGTVYQDLLTMAQEIVDFAEGPVQQLKARGLAAAKPARTETAAKAG
jgi:ParB/RepB/Spo0J family partition protein